MTEVELSSATRFRLVEDNYFLVLVAIVIAFVLVGLFSSVRLRQSRWGWS